MVTIAILRAVLPRGFEFRAAFHREFECLASCNSLREAEPRLLELQLGFLSCLSFLNEGNSCVFSQGILNSSNHLLLSHKHRQGKLKLNTALISHNISPDLWDNVSCQVLLCQRCYLKLLQIEGRFFCSLYEARYSLWLCKTNWILGQCISHSCTILTSGTGDLTPFQLPIGKKVLVPFCVYIGFVIYLFVQTF